MATPVLRCTFGGEQLAIYWMDGNTISYLAMPWAKAQLWGTGRWNVDCSSHAECMKVQRIIGGDMGQTFN